MFIFLAFLLAGSVAQLVDGSLGMGFGITSSSLLLVLGFTPVVISTAAHVAEMPTSLASAIAHVRARNIDHRLLARLAIPGSLAAFLGAVALSNLDMSGSRVWMSLLLIVLGVTLVLRYGFRIQIIPRIRTARSLRSLPFLGAFAGFIDATGGGGWGPVTVPALLTITDQTPRKVVGTVNTSEFFVTVGAVLGFLIASGFAGVPWLAVVGLSLGGVIAAPFAARLTARIPQESMGVLVGGMVIAVNARYIIPSSVLLGTLIVLGIGVLTLAWLRRPRSVADSVAVGV